MDLRWHTLLRVLGNLPGLEHQWLSQKVKIPVQVWHRNLSPQQHKSSARRGHSCEVSCWKSHGSELEMPLSLLLVYEDAKKKDCEEMGPTNGVVFIFRQRRSQLAERPNSATLTSSWKKKTQMTVRPWRCKDALFWQDCSSNSVFENDHSSWSCTERKLNQDVHETILMGPGGERVALIQRCVSVVHP